MQKLKDVDKMERTSEKEIKKILEFSRSIAIVGISDSVMKPSNQVARYLQKAGYRIYPVNPKYDQILGVKCYPDLKSIEFGIDIVDIFRRPEHVPAVVKEAIEINAKVIWMQLGIVNEAAAQDASKNGLQVVMDRCMKIEHRKLNK